MNRIISFIAALLLFLPGAKSQFALPAMQYSYDAFVPHIDSTTMRIHYNNHHRTYVNNLNAAIEKYPALKNKGLEELLSEINLIPEDIRVSIRNNGGGHFNHSFFWTILTPKPTKPSSKLEQAIISEFGSMERFKAEFEKAATSRFGSGWVWLIVSDKLKIITTPNQDNPLLNDAPEKGAPILALDVWEHAYYLKYQSNRGAYVKAFWNVVNWDKVSDLYKAYRK
ncbi:MAG: superoxide dismutase [Prevotellaceae bacterium]|nr:superoxide dismutase [Prevotellaceae bacterium]